MTVRKLQLTVHPQDRIREEHTQLLCIGSIHRERPPAQPQNNQQRLSPEFLPLPPNWSPCFLLALLYYPHSNQDDSFKTSVTSCHFSPAASHHLQAQCNLAQISSELTSHPIPLPHHMPAAPAPWRFLKYTSMFPPHSHKDSGNTTKKIWYRKKSTLKNTFFSLSQGKEYIYEQIILNGNKLMVL